MLSPAQEFCLARLPVVRATLCDPPPVFRGIEEASDSRPSCTPRPAAPRNRTSAIGPTSRLSGPAEERQLSARSCILTGMARYYLHIHNSHGAAEDNEGMEAANLSEAREKAVQGIRSLLGAEAENGHINFKGRIDISDATGKVLLSVPFKEAMTVVGL
jgi:hypothetical protein